MQNVQGVLKKALETGLKAVARDSTNSIMKDLGDQQIFYRPAHLEDIRFNTNNPWILHLRRFDEKANNSKATNEKSAPRATQKWMDMDLETDKFEGLWNVRMFGNIPVFPYFAIQIICDDILLPKWSPTDFLHSRLY